MHGFQHVVSGRMALDVVTSALALDAADIVNMDDDLSVGPLHDVEAEQSPSRVAFWRRIFGPQADDFEREHRQFTPSIAATARALRELPVDHRPCMVWFGTGANEQLTLRWVANVLQSSPREIWTGEVLPIDQKPLPRNWCTGVGVCNESDVLAIYGRRSKLSAEDRRRLGGEWTIARDEAREDTLRHFVEGRISTWPISGYDDRILGALDSLGDRGTTLQTVRVVGEAMVRSEDAMIGDVFIFWRIRELTRQGVLHLDPFDAPMRESVVRRAG